MRLLRIQLPARDVDAIARFFADVLELPVTHDHAEVTVTVGASELTFIEDPTLSGAQHLAMTIPTGSFPAARAWLEARVSLLSQDGVDEFEASPAWNARSLYFDGPDLQVLELIERRDLSQPYQGGFRPDDLLCVSEVGAAVPDVLAAVDTLRAGGVEPYGNPPGGGFAAVGDVHGMLILVTPGRPWAPTDDRPASDSTTKIDADLDGPITLAAGRVELTAR